MRNSLWQLAAIVVLCLGGTVGESRALFDTAASYQNYYPSDEIPLIYADELRHAAVHDAGDFYLPIVNSRISTGFGAAASDPETGEYLTYATYPQASDNCYIFGGGFWIGGIINTDTLVSTGVDGWFYAFEFSPEDRDHGGVRRIGRFADDEFMTVVVDTFPVSGGGYPHQPLGLEAVMTSYSWADTVYDDFVIIEQTIHNFGGSHIHEGWVGLYLDNDVYHESNQSSGYGDDLSGCLDTLLDDNDPGSRVLIPYSFDNDGDPNYLHEWSATSVRGIVAVMLLDCSFPVEGSNFNWWVSSGNLQLDFGPRRVGTPEDPFHVFYEDNLGTPVSDGDKYYVMSHPEVDYDQIETAIHDSSDGWIPFSPSGAIDFANGFDTRFLFSFGSFDLPPGDSVTFAVALIGGKNLHTDPGAWAEYFDAAAPEVFESTLDFSDLMIHCRRADSVYRSGFLLPNPGPPAGLKVVDYGAAYVTVGWHPLTRPDLAGYHLYLKDTVYTNQWNRVGSALLTDSIGTVGLYEPLHTYFVSVSAVDVLGRESAVSLPVSVLPGKPHPPESLTVTLDGLIPEISWRPDVDTALQVYMVYRALWEQEFTLYDSTTATVYRDYGAESGVKYNYMVTAVNLLELESEAAGPVSVVPMALDQGILYCNLTNYAASNPPPYKRLFFERICESISSVTPTTQVDVRYDGLAFKQLADYGLLIIDRGSVLRTMSLNEDSLSLYLQHGGRAIFIQPTFEYIGVNRKVHIFGDGDLYHDCIKLDSAVTSAIVFQDAGMAGDLCACQPLQPEYEWLEADMEKLAETTLPIYGCIPLAGYLYPSEEAESIYSYVSSNPDTIHHGAITGIRYIGEDYGVVFLTFPLMVMTEQANMRVMRQALIDLGINMSCGDVDENGKVTIGDVVYVINYLYRAGPAPADEWKADVDCDQALSMGDIVSLINYVFKGGWVDCCF